MWKGRSRGGEKRADLNFEVKVRKEVHPSSSGKFS